MLRKYIRENTTFFAILLFILFFGIIQIMKPSCFYNQDGSIREFGIGYKNKTIFPIWLLSIVLGIFSYISVMYYISYSKLIHF